MIGLNGKINFEFQRLAIFHFLGLDQVPSGNQTWFAGKYHYLQLEKSKLETPISSRCPIATLDYRRATHRGLEFFSCGSGENWDVLSDQEQVEQRKGCRREIHLILSFILGNISLYIYICVPVCRCICILECMCIYLNLYIYIYICICVYIQTWRYVFVYLYIYMYICICVYV